MTEYKPIPGRSPTADAIKKLRARERRAGYATAGQLNNTSDKIQQQIDFLLSQSVYVRNQLQWTDLEQTSGSGQWQWKPYEPWSEAEKGNRDYFTQPFMSSSTGRIRVTTYADLMVNNGNEFVLAGMALAPEVMRLDNAAAFNNGRGGTPVIGVSVDHGAKVLGVNCGEIRGTYAQTRVFEVEPNAPHFVRTRRAILKPVSGSSWGGVYYTYVIVEKLGM